MEERRQVTIDAPPAVVWRCLTEVALLKQWLPNFIDDVPANPANTGLGAVSSTTIKEGSRNVTYDSVVTAWEPEKRIAIRLSGGSFAPGMAMDIDYALNTTDRPGQTRVDYYVHVPLVGFMFKLMAPFIWLVSRGNAKKALAALAVFAQGMK